ncbi:hypothetical protein QYF36_000292 [Acer negundo]|nr:hypothetical protein QYF36_000292 [Acer negundo]
MSLVHFLPGISSRMLLVEGFAKGSSKVLKLQMVEYSRGTLSLDIASVSKALDFFNFNFDYFMMREEEEELQKQELPCRVQYMALEDCKCPVKLEEALQNLSSLRGLSISVSPGIISFPEAFLPSQLSFMVIRKCDSDLVIEVLKEMKQQGCPPNDVICYATISGMCNLLMKKKTAGMVLSGLKFSGFESMSEEKGCKLLPSLNCEARLSYVICSAVSGMYKDAILDEARKVFRDFRFESCIVEGILFDVPQMKSFEFCIRPQFLWIQTANFVILPLDLISAKKEDDTSLVKFVDKVNFIKSLSSMSICAPALKKRTDSV